MEKKINIEFSANTINVLKQDPDCMMAELFLLHEGLNRNSCDISHESVLRSQKTFYNKPIVYRLNNSVDPLMSTDTTDHSKDQDTSMLQAGIIPESAPIEFVKKNGKVYLKTLGIIHKIYNPTLVKILKNRNGNIKVSIEIKVVDGYRNDSGVFVINEFILLSVCLLGMNVKEGIEGSCLNVTKFSNKDYNDKYIKFSKNIEKSVSFNIEENVKKAVVKSESLYKKQEENKLMENEEKKGIDTGTEEVKKNVLDTKTKETEEVKKEEAPKKEAPKKEPSEEPKDDKKKEEPVVAKPEEKEKYSERIKELEKENKVLKASLEKFEREKEIEVMKNSLEKCSKIFSEKEYKEMFDNIEKYSKVDFDSKLAKAAIEFAAKFSAKEEEVKSEPEKEQKEEVGSKLSYSVGFPTKPFSAPKVEKESEVNSLEDVFKKYNVQ